MLDIISQYPASATYKHFTQASYLPYKINLENSQIDENSPGDEDTEPAESIHSYNPVCQSVRQSPVTLIHAAMHETTLSVDHPLFPRDSPTTSATSHVADPVVEQTRSRQAHSGSIESGRRALVC